MKLVSGGRPVLDIHKHRTSSEHVSTFVSHAIEPFMALTDRMGGALCGNCCVQLLPSHAQVSAALPPPNTITCPQAAS
jgi:hypothetical protein